MRSIVRTSFETELPPRARRILTGLAFQLRLAGTTSACAENTSGLVAHTPASGNYLRVRGEYLPGFGIVLAWWELPPRARRILVAFSRISLAIGTTSACAENTRIILIAITANRNYLRVRGEYTPPSEDDWGHVELPPRARRIRLPREVLTATQGTTSACAENTAGQC